MKPSELLKNPGAWCQGWEARNANGNECCADSKDAVKWSIDGALDRCTDAEDQFKDALLAVFTVIGKPRWDIKCLMEWNDAPDRKHKEVIEVLKRAGL